MDVLKNNGIEMSQIVNFFKKIDCHINSLIKVKENKEDIDLVKKIFEKKKINTNGWKLWKMKKCKIFKNTILVYLLTWGGAELCGFQSEKDKHYHGFEYGSTDYIFIKDKQVLHIGSLLIHSIVSHNFFQDTNSSFRVKPEKLIDFFNLKSSVDYTTEYLEDRYTKYISQICSESVLKLISDIDKNKYSIEIRKDYIYWNSQR